MATARKQRLAIEGAASRPERFLALSGGGSDGAFGAGLLVGWTDHGDRPQFDVVTGVSTGAIIAPFAFLGSRYDGWLAQFYTEYGSPDLIRYDWLSGILGGPAIADSAPLKRLIGRFITPELLAEIAAEHRKGRRLFVGTTNLDAQRPVTWDLGAIAASGNPEAPELFRQVLLASTSIPMAFPPVRFSVHAGGNSYQELHADGSIASPVFFLPSDFKLSDVDRLFPSAPRRELYVIRNGRIDPSYLKVEDDLISLTGRAFTTMSKRQTAGELLRLCLIARRDNIEYRLAYIPSSFDRESQSIVDLDYMKALFQTARRLGTAGFDWKKSPPLCEADL